MGFLGPPNFVRRWWERSKKPKTQLISENGVNTKTGGDEVLWGEKTLSALAAVKKEGNSFVVLEGDPAGMSGGTIFQASWMGLAGRRLKKGEAALRKNQAFRRSKKTLKSTKNRKSAKGCKVQRLRLGVFKGGVFPTTKACIPFKRGLKTM